MMKPITLLSSILLIAAILLSAPLLSIAQNLAPSLRANSATAGANDPIVIKTEVVSFSVAVIDNQGRYFTGLDKSAFTVFEDDISQEISFFRLDDGPATIAVVFDLSGSMNGGKIQRARDALSGFVQTGHQDDEYSLISFSEQVNVSLESARGGEALMSRVANATPRGHTALYDAISIGLEQVTQGHWSKRALIVISDGEDNHSRASLKKLKQMIGESGAIIYAVVIEDLLPRVFAGSEMRELAAISGGAIFFPGNAEQMAEAFDKIAVDLRRRYSIGYSPSNFSADGRWRSLKVKITPPPGAPRLVALARKGYYASACHARQERR
jgi:Ca-activated chloride channel homolog